MKSPESFRKQEAEMPGSPEMNKGLAPIISILEEVSIRYQELVKAADEMVLYRKEKGSEEKLKEATRLLVDLPERITPLLEGVNEEMRDRIAEKIEYFATTGRRLLEEDNDFGMGVLLIHRGSRDGDENKLQELIADLKKAGG